jgi:crotonobetainyl-CoA:carnitine CoA-transferase CaiB-like acyl-CoA transferase
MPAPLDGLLVADFSRVLAGPLVGMLLGDLGADVVKVERPGTGDDTRSWGPPWVDGASTYYLGLNRNKRSLTLDLSDDADRALARRLASHADIVLENFKPGTAAKLGLGYRDVSAENPAVVYVSITGFGAQPGGAELPGYDLLVQAASGLMSVTGEPDGRPLKVGVALVDVVTGLYATIGVLAAIEARHTTGRGQHVEVSLMGSALAALVNQASGFVAGGSVPRRAGNRHPSIAPYETFDAADRQFVLACGNDSQFGRVAEVVGEPDLATDDRFATNAARVAHVDELAAILNSVFRRDVAAHWVERCLAAGVPAGPINSIAEAFEFASTIGLDAVVGGAVATVANPLRFSETPVEVTRDPPRLGAHDTELRAWLHSLPPRHSDEPSQGEPPP